MKKKNRWFLCIVLSLTLGHPAVAAKPVVGVAEFTNTSGAYWWGGGVGWELSSMLSNELSNTKDFKVVERAVLEPVLREQDLNAGGRIAKGTGAEIGRMTGAQYLVMGTVSAFESNTSNTGGGFSISGISIGGNKGDAYMAIDLRVVDTSTSEVVHSRTIEGRASSRGLNLGLFRGGFGGHLSSEKKTPAGKAIRAGIVEATDYLVCVMVTQTESCINEFDSKEQKRKDSLKDQLKLDGP